MEVVSEGVLLGWVMDRSTSMQVAAEGAVSGFNQFVEEQKAIEGELLVSLVLFADDFEVALSARPIAQVPEMKLVDRKIRPALAAASGRLIYYPHGNTALLAACTKTINGMQLWIDRHPEWTGKVKVIIFTDGEENASGPMYSRGQLDGLIEAKKAAGWEFIFMGSGGSAWLEGRSMHSTRQDTYSVGVGSDAVLASANVASQAMTDTRIRGEAMAGAFRSAYGNPDEAEAHPPVISGNVGVGHTSFPSNPPVPGQGYVSGGRVTFPLVGKDDVAEALAGGQRPSSVEEDLAG